MPYFTPDCEKFAIGRPYATWWVKLIDDTHILAFKTKTSEPVKLYSPFQEELDEYQYTFDAGRETFVSYELVREMNLTQYGRVFYRDDFDRQYTDQYIARPQPGKTYNQPFDRAVVPEPIWNPLPPPPSFDIHVTDLPGRTVVLTATVAGSGNEVDVSWDLLPDPSYYHDVRVVVSDPVTKIAYYDKVQPYNASSVDIKVPEIPAFVNLTVQAFATWYDDSVTLASNVVPIHLVDAPNPAVDVETTAPPTRTLVQVQFKWPWPASPQEQEVVDWVGQVSLDGGATWTDKTVDRVVYPLTDEIDLAFDFTATPLPQDAQCRFRVVTRNPYGEAYSNVISYVPYSRATLTLVDDDDYDETAILSWSYDKSAFDQVIDQDLHVYDARGVEVDAFDYDNEVRNQIIHVHDKDDLKPFVQYTAVLRARLVDKDGTNYQAESEQISFIFGMAPEPPNRLGTSGGFPPTRSAVWILWSSGYNYSAAQMRITEYRIFMSEDLQTWKDVGVSVKAGGSTEVRLTFDPPLRTATRYHFGVQAISKWGKTNSWEPYPPDPAIPVPSVYTLMFPLATSEGGEA